jgi:hypothetical protein
MGQLLTCTHVAQGASIALLGQTYQVDFQGSTTVLLDPDKLARFKAGVISIVPMQVQADTNDGIGNIIGPTTWRQDPDRIPPQSTLTSTDPDQPFPAVHDYLLNIQVTIPNLLPGITLRNKITNGQNLILRNTNVTDFPSQNAVYNLVAPVELEDVNNPGPVLATLLSFPSIWTPGPLVAAPDFPVF